MVRSMLIEGIYHLYETWVIWHPTHWLHLFTFTAPPSLSRSLFLPFPVILWFSGPSFPISPNPPSLLLLLLNLLISFFITNTFVPSPPLFLYSASSSYRSPSLIPPLNPSSTFSSTLCPPSFSPSHPLPSPLRSCRWYSRLLSRLVTYPVAPILILIVSHQLCRGGPHLY